MPRGGRIRFQMTSISYVKTNPRKKALETNDYNQVWSKFEFKGALGQMKVFSNLISGALTEGATIKPVLPPSKNIRWITYSWSRTKI